MSRYRICMLTLRSARRDAPNRVTPRRRARRKTFNEVDFPRVSYRM